MEITRGAALPAAKHNAFTNFPKDPDCEVCKRNKITRAPCRKCSSDYIACAENFGDLITTHHKILNEGGELRNNQGYAVVVPRFSHSVDSKLSVENKDFTRNDEFF